MEDIKKTVIKIMIAFVVLVLAGCDKEDTQFFDKRTIETHSKDIVRDLSQTPVIPDVNNKLPEYFVAPPEIKTINPNDTKLYYFTKNQTPEKLAELVKAQLGYQVDINPSTNQIIVKAKAPEDGLVALDFLQQVDVPPIQVRIDCLISEVFADATLDYETSVQIGNLFGLSGGGRPNTVNQALGQGIGLAGAGNNYTAFPGASFRDPARSKEGLLIGLATPDGSFNAAINLLQSKGYLKVLMNPTLRTINGKLATITTTDQVPVLKSVFTPGINPYTITDYVPVTDSLEVMPNVYADGSVGLKTKAVIGSTSMPAGASQQTIITKREVNIDENRIRPGDSLVIGGIRKSESLGIIRGAPFLQDVPLLGILFSSKDQQESVKEIMFILTPSISSPGMDYETMVAGIRQKHLKPQEDPNILKSFMEPFCKSKYAEYVEKKAAESEVARIKAEAVTVKTQEQMTQLVKETNEEKAKAQNDMNQAAKVKAEAQTIKAQADQVKAETEKLKTEVEALKTQAEQKKAESDAAQAAADAKRAEAQKAILEAEQRKTDVIKAMVDANEKKNQAALAAADAEKKQAQALQAIADAQKAQIDAQKAKAEAEKIIIEAEKARLDMFPHESNDANDPNLIADPNKKPV